MKARGTTREVEGKVSQSGFYIGRIVPSDVDGPGTRAVVHFAGCSIGCPGCFNPHTHSKTMPGVWQDTAQSVARRMLEVSPHVTISGGEPTDQDQALWDLLIELRKQGAESIVMFTGRRIEWLAKNRASWPWIQDEGLVDVIVDGPYVAKLNEPSPVMRGSSNQRLIFCTDLFSSADFRDRDIQITVDAEGLTVTGFPDAELLEALSLMAG